MLESMSHRKSVFLKEDDIRMNRQPIGSSKNMRYSTKVSEQIGNKSQTRALVSSCEMKQTSLKNKKESKNKLKLKGSLKASHFIADFVKSGMFSDKDPIKTPRKRQKSANPLLGTLFKSERSKPKLIQVLNHTKEVLTEYNLMLSEERRINIELIQENKRLRQRLNRSNSKNK